MAPRIPFGKSILGIYESCTEEKATDCADCRYNGKKENPIGFPMGFSGSMDLISFSV